MRQQRYEANGLTVIDDTYNASPDSMMGNIDVLCSMKATGRRIAVLADMLELGDVSVEAHRSVGRRCAQKKVDILYVIGQGSQRDCRGRKRAGTEMDCREFMDNASALASLKETVRAGILCWSRVPGECTPTRLSTGCCNHFCNYTRIVVNEL